MCVVIYEYHSETSFSLLSMFLRQCFLSFLFISFYIVFCAWTFYTQTASRLYFTVPHLTSLQSYKKPERVSIDIASQSQSLIKLTTPRFLPDARKKKSVFMFQMNSSRMRSC